MLKYENSRKIELNSQFIQNIYGYSMHRSHFARIIVTDYLPWWILHQIDIQINLFCIYFWFALHDRWPLEWFYFENRMRCVEICYRSE